MADAYDIVELQLTASQIEEALTKVLTLQDIKTATINSSGHLIITLLNNQTIDCGTAKGATGAKGADGKDGANITNITINSSGQLVITLSSGSSVTAGKVVPIKGTDYFTTAEKQQIVQDVLAALPYYNGSVSNT